MGKLVPFGPDNDKFCVANELNRLGGAVTFINFKVISIPVEKYLSDAATFRAGRKVHAFYITEDQYVTTSLFELMVQNI